MPYAQSIQTSTDEISKNQFKTHIYENLVKSFKTNLPIHFFG